VEEAPVWIAVNGTRRIVLNCTPRLTTPLAAGHLLAEGWIRSAADLLDIVEVAGPGGACGVAVRTDAALVNAAERLRQHQTTHGCGLRHFLDCAPLAARPPAVQPPPELGAAFRTLFAAADDASPVGGVHAAALCTGAGELQHVAIDVARHCAVDRALGTALLAGDDPARFGLVLTSRVSAAIALKAARSGAAWIASRSLGTPLARELAAAAGLPLLEQAARRERPA
jgi:FdhD protein